MGNFPTCDNCHLNPAEGDLCQACRMRIDQEKQQQIEKRDRLIQVTGGPMPYVKFTIEQFEIIPENEEALKIANGFDPDEANLFFWGCCGGGKTHLTTAIARRQAEKNIRVSRQTVTEFLRGFRALDGYEEQGKIEAFSRIPILIWDDLGRGKVSDFGLDVLCEIADKRLMNFRRGLIVTSNFNPDQLVEKFHDDRLVSRLVGMCEVAHMEGPKDCHGDWRVRNAGSVGKQRNGIRSEGGGVR